jgi:ABC-2 type transport system ATP-binding protein
MSGAVRAEGVRKAYRRGPAVLDGVDLALEPGVPVVLSGANGSGKSTLLRIVAGAATPSGGRVTGRPRVVGYLPDRFPAQLRMPAEVYLRHLAAVRGVRAAPELLEALDFTGPRREPMARLSKGNAQKVGLAQALGGGPGLVVLDEPWAGLDGPAADVLLATLADTAVPLLVTDHTGRAARIPAARHVRLADGRVRESLPPVPAPPRSRVVLRAADPRAELAWLGGRGGIEGECVVLHVPPSDVDSLLFAALGRGCSVVSVGPA